MDEEEEVAETRHFWKFMWPGFHEKLVLPPDFCRKSKGEMPKHAILKSECGRKKVGVCENDEGGICFEEGWEDFANKNGLTVGNVLVFEHTGSFHFNVIVFDETGCEKELQQQGNLDNHRIRAKKKPTTDPITSYDSPNPHFTVTMKPRNGSKIHNGSWTWAAMSIPTTFLRSNDMSKKTSATLRNPSGKTWKVNLSFSTVGNIKCTMSKGWNKFYTSNKLKDGDVCVFEVLQHHPQRSTEVVMDVKIFRGGRGLPC